MVALPAATPVTKPVVAETDAIPGLELLHAPPEVASDNAELVPIQNEAVPVIAAGNVPETV